MKFLVCPRCCWYIFLKLKQNNKFFIFELLILYINIIKSRCLPLLYIMMIGKTISRFCSTKGNITYMEHTYFVLTSFSFVLHLAHLFLVGTFG